MRVAGAADPGCQGAGVVGKRSGRAQSGAARTVAARSGTADRAGRAGSGPSDRDHRAGRRNRLAPRRNYRDLSGCPPGGRRARRLRRRDALSAQRADPATATGGVAGRGDAGRPLERRPGRIAVQGRAVRAVPRRRRRRANRAAAAARGFARHAAGRASQRAAVPRRAGLDRAAAAERSAGCARFGRRSAARRGQSGVLPGPARGNQPAGGGFPRCGAGPAGLGRGADRGGGLVRTCAPGGEWPPRYCRWGWP